MVQWVDSLRNFLHPFGQYVGLRRRGDEDNTNGHWSKKIDSHTYGQYSFAVVQANQQMEDYSQVEVGKNATFVGVYDGHGGDKAAWYVIKYGLFPNIIRLAQENEGSISEQLLRNAFSVTENEFVTFARVSRDTTPTIHEMGSCCLIGLIWNKKLYLGNLGDSRAVLGRAIRRNSKEIIAEQLTPDHNVNLPDVRREVQVEHQDHDPNVVVQDQHGVWRIKGSIQISRSIGDLYLKTEEFANISIPRPFLRSDPFLETRNIEPTDKFVIFASDGLWEHLTIQKAVDIVSKNPRLGIAKKLVKQAMKKAGKGHGLRNYKKVKNLEIASRRPIHDDISVIVLFIDHDLLESGGQQVQEVSVKAFSDETPASGFQYIHGGASTSGGGGASTSGYGGASTSGGGGGASTSGGGASTSRWVASTSGDGASTSGGGASTSNV